MKRNGELSDRFVQALAYAARTHADHKRKGTDIPYVSHLLGVAGIALTYGADEDEAIAALLHDAIEDRGAARRAEIRAHFGDRVTEIVDDCTDTDVEPKPPWMERKERYLKHLREASSSARLVSAADKLDNARAILSDYRTLGAKLWPRFNAGPEDLLWHYRSVVNVLRAAGDTPLVRELDAVVTELERLVAADCPGFIKMKERLAKAGIECPPIPPELAPRIKEFSPWCFGTAMGRLSPYAFGDYIDAGIKRSAPDSVLFAHAGHGVNSYALHYYLVHGPLRLFVQIGWGGAYMDASKADRNVNESFALAGRVVEAVDSLVRTRRWPRRKRLIIAASGFSGSYWTTSPRGPTLGRDMQPPQILEEALHWLEELQ